MSYLPKDKKIKLPAKRIILVDDREKKPWKFPNDSGYKLQTQRLKIGDYTFKGAEEIVAIEKKSGWQEILTDISAKYRPGFKKFLERLANLPLKCMVIEDDITYMNDSPNFKYGRLKVDSLIFWYNKIILEYEIPIILIGKKNLHLKARLISNVFITMEQEWVKRYA